MHAAIGDVLPNAAMVVNPIEKEPKELVATVEEIGAGRSC
jgi:hypothetical protein